MNTGRAVVSDNVPDVRLRCRISRAPRTLANESGDSRRLVNQSQNELPWFSKRDENVFDARKRRVHQTIIAAQTLRYTQGVLISKRNLRCRGNC